MGDALTQVAMNLNGNSRRRKNWQKVVSILACIVVFCTTYALILPAITMEKEAICGMEEHEHSESCFEKQITYSLNCMLETTDEVVVHKHNELCYGADGTLICTLPEVLEHSHEETCYDHVGNLLCTLSEISLHSHEDVCYDEQESLLCEKSLISEHIHVEGCLVMNESSVLVCEVPVHIHGDHCFAEPEAEEKKDFLHSCSGGG